MSNPTNAADPWWNDPIHTASDWRAEVANNDTRLGYPDWVQQQRTELRRDTTAFRWTFADLDGIAGREVTADEVARISKAVDYSTAGDAVLAAVEQVCGLPDDDEPEHDPMDRCANECVCSPQEKHDSLSCDEDTCKVGPHGEDENNPLIMAQSIRDSILAAYHPWCRPQCSIKFCQRRAAHVIGGFDLDGEVRTSMVCGLCRSAASSDPRSRVIVALVLS